MSLRALALVALAMLELLAGCAQYEIRQPMANRGTVLVTWEVNPARVPGNHCGWAEQIAANHWLISFRRAYDPNHECVIHELWHAMKGIHQ